jgi:hypothetical protein
MSALRKLPALTGVVAALVAMGCGRSADHGQSASALESDPQYQQAQQDFQKVLDDAAKPVPHRKDFKVPASRAAGKTGLDLVNVVTDPMIDALSEIEDSRQLQERLNHQQYVTWILFTLAVDIDDGGLAEMYYNGSGAFATEAPALLREAGAPEHARIIEQANHLFAPNGRVPTDEDARRAMSDGVDDDRFAALDDQLMNLDELDDINARYIAAHRSAYFYAG